MDERSFVARKRQAWDRLATIVRHTEKLRGIRELNRDDLLAFGSLYRRASSDLAYARQRNANPDLVEHLNEIVGRANALLYEAQKSASPARSIWEFYAYEFPAILQRRARYFVAAAGVTAVSAAMAYGMVVTHPDRWDLFIPAELRADVKVWQSGNVANPAHPATAGWLFTHNLTVDLIGFSGGILAGVPTAAALYYNGVMFGAFAAVITRAHRGNVVWPGIVPHGVAEFTAMFIAGAAGFVLGKAFVLPGPYRRADAVRMAGVDAVKLAEGTIPLLIFAAIIEGMFSHLAWPAGVRYTFAVANGLIWYLYLFLPRGRRPAAPGTP